MDTSRAKRITKELATNRLKMEELTTRYNRQVMDGSSGREIDQTRSDMHDCLDMVLDLLNEAAQVSQ